MEAGDVKAVVGLADGCELMGALTRFPDAGLARGVVDGSVHGDAMGCAADMTASSGEQWEGMQAACEGFGVSEDDEVAVCDSLRRAWSLLYARQGSGVAIFPYESAFIHVRMGAHGAPALFRTALTLRVERAMREAHALPVDAGTEPCDSAWNEWSFLARLLGNEAAALMAGDGESAALWRDRAASFTREHAGQWLPDFLARTEEELSRLAAAGGVDRTAERFYGALAAYGRFVLKVLTERAA